MPVSTACKYSAPFWCPGGHAQTIAPRILQIGPFVRYQRERLELDDGDFVDIDWLFADAPERRSQRLVILSHGLEGDTSRSYMRSMAKCFADRGWDVAARHFRGCSGEPNRLLRCYHSGETDDLERVIRHGESLGYREIALVGFSAGGNQVLFYLGESPATVAASVVGGAAISVPCDLSACSTVLARPENRMYMEYFLRTLRRKMLEKSQMFPGEINVTGLDEIRTFKEFDDRFTSPIYGFSCAEDYWKKASSKQHLDAIRLPSLIINAKNDPFLAPTCYPMRTATKSDNIQLLIPRDGGHVGFPGHTGSHSKWLGNEVVSFFDRQVTH